MHYNLDKSSGRALIIASLLMVFTMVLHPTGGSFVHLLKVSALIVATHSIAIVAIMIIAYGFWGLTCKLKSDVIFSTFAFIVIAFGLIAVMCAAAANGLVLPMFVKRFAESDEKTIDSIQQIITYNTLLNHAFDYIFIGSGCISVLLWSIAIIRTNVFAKWIGWFGIALTAITILLLIAGFVFVSLYGFRVFVFGFVCWILIVGYFLQSGQRS